MASSINPNNIDGAYPVAGQDNDSQGFRDNFTNTKTNFQYAAQEITDLQNKVILKAPLGSASTTSNDMGGNSLFNVELYDVGQRTVSLTTVSGLQTINYALGSYYTLSTGGSVELQFTNFPPSGQYATVIVRVNVTNTAYTLTLPSAVGASLSADSLDGIQGINTSTNVITFAQTGAYELQFGTSDGGTSIYLTELTRPRSYFTNTVNVAATTASTSTSTGALIVAGGAGVAGNAYVGGNSSTAGVILASSSEDLVANAAASLSVHASYFTTAAAETATLAAGTAGQIKVLAATNVSAGDMVITVTNPAWGGAGTVTFNAAGQACTLQYINSKWFCIGNNGATFA